MCDIPCTPPTGSASQLFASALNVLAASQCLLYNTTIRNDTLPDQKTFDFIIIGGGSAGSVVANRLSEINKWNILLLEAGPVPPVESDIPYMDTTLYQSKYDWQYVTKSDAIKHQGLKNGIVRWPRGKMLGGCSSMNAMFYVRGRDYDYQSWCNEGNPSWTAENVNYYFKKAENFQDTKFKNNSRIYGAYGHEGPLEVNTYNSTYRELTQKVIDSWDYIGIKEVPDFNAATFRGHGFSGLTRVTVSNGQRQSTYRAYLYSANNRNNLKILTNAFVTKILINDEARAYGVEVDVNGTRRRFFTTLEVIVSTGSINTPQLLMLSGIGPKEHLLTKNITCLVNLPGVGKNLQDHPYITFLIYGNGTKSDDTGEQLFDVIKYLYNKTGYLAHGSVTDVMAFFSRHMDIPYPEFQSHLAVFWKNSSTIRNYLSVFKDEIVDSITRNNSEKVLFLFALNILHPFSRGSIVLNTSNPYDHPIIEANYLADKRDLQASVDGLKILTNLLYAPYFRSIDAFIPQIDLPQCNHYEFLSDLYWKCYSLHMTHTVFHPIGTAKMGPNPLDSVVNNFLKVHGVKNVRVIDASVMPFLTSGNTNAPTIMIGELGSDMIKAEYLGKLY